MKRQFLLFTLALFMVKAGMAQSNPTSTNSQNAAAIANNSGEYVSSYDNSYQHVVTDGWTFSNSVAIQWKDGAGGSATVEWFNDFYGPDYELDSYNWPSNSWPEALPSGWGLELVNGTTNWQGTVSPLDLSVQEHCDADFTMDYSFGPHETFHRMTQTKLTLATGGEPGSTNVNLWRVSANATAQTLVPSGGTFPDDPPVNSSVGSIPFTSISAGVFGPLDADGYAYKLLPDNTNVDVTPYVAGEDHYSFSDPPEPVTLTSLDVVSNSAVQVGGTNNWAAVKTATNDWVYLQACISTGDTNAANLIQWSPNNLELVPGNPFQRRLTKTNSVETTVTATLGSTNKTVNVWIVWSTVQILMSGTNPVNAPQFESNSISYLDGTETLGIQGYEFGTYDAAAGKICFVATISPTGTHSIITSGWDLHQNKWVHSFINGGVSVGSYQAEQDTNWVPDEFGSDFKNIIPDNSDKLYGIDGPEVFGGPVDTRETYNNFNDNVTLNLGNGDQICSDTNNFWHWQGRWKFYAVPEITFTNLGPGLISLPTNAYYPTSP